MFGVKVGVRISSNMFTLPPWTAPASTRVVPSVPRPRLFTSHAAHRGAGDLGWFWARRLSPGKQEGNVAELIA